ncbi:unnamed protein product [Ilex paraguariensis]|uniref:Leucine-rich repeat-containing N-terminal plant-type domain-containing protein n=1 Tax=Ilex paraguariensis TaxID=185542 RepID=A0ABC8S876_9AQUA
MGTSIPTLALLIFLLIVVGNSNSTIICHEKKRTTLLNFRNGLTNLSSSWLSSWSVQENSCQWIGVHYDNVTGRVIKLDLFGMQLQGEINQLGNLSRLLHLDLGINNGLFVGDLSWISGLHSLKYLDMSGVDLSKIVNWLHEMNKLPSLSELLLSSCGLESVYPSLSYVNFTSLTVLDLSSNLFKREVPNWLDNLSTSLIYLQLRGNALQGQIPVALSNIHDLRYLNFYGNQLNGPIPASIGRQLEYKRNLKLVRSIDLSSNNLFGSIPVELFGLFELRFLNMSHNRLVGEIPENIGSMTTLECLDLSKNDLSGKIPESMSNMAFLDYLNLSYNYLSGSIPSGTQLQSLGEDTFIGNAELCGAPLLINSTKDEESHGSTPVHKNGDESEMFWFYIGMGMGFVISFWGVCVVIFFKSTWRNAYFKFLDELKDRIYVAAAKGEMVPQEIQ